MRYRVMVEVKYLLALIDCKPLHKTRSLSKKALTSLKKLGMDDCRIEGKESTDWKLVDAHDVIVHLFHPEKREFYDLEKMWSEEIPKQKAMI